MHILHILHILHMILIMHIVTFIVSLSGFKLSSDEDEPSLQPDDIDDVESNLVQPPMIGPLILQQQPAPATAPFDFIGPFKRAHWDHNPLHSMVQSLS